MNTTFTLKNIKVCEWASEETTCFTATLYMNGKRLGEVRNDGQGGCNYYDFNTKEIKTIAEEYLWNAHVDFCKEYNFEPQEKDTFHFSLDPMIDNLLDQHDLAKQVKTFTNKVAKRNPAHADKIRIYLVGAELIACFAGTTQEAEIASKPNAELASSKVEITI
jgi:hypothetical protein